MDRLILLFNKQVINEYPFEGESITIGRKDDNSIVIDNLSVSSYHARIDQTGSDYLLTDLQSTNGTFVNDKKISSHKLTHGDNVVIGKHVLLFLSSVREKMNGDEGEKQELDLNQTMVLNTAKYKELLSKQSDQLKQRQVSNKIGVIHFIDSSRLGEIELTKKLTKIGKADSSEIKLSGFFIGPTAATISRRPSGYVLTFTGGRSRVKVNGKVVENSVQLKEFDTIEIGSYKFQFYEKEIKED